MEIYIFNFFLTNLHINKNLKKFINSILLNLGK
jgi:hypothetical protein